MNIVIPMAGRGARFQQAGFATPKPLILVRGKPMYAWAVESLPLTITKRLIFVCLREHLSDSDLTRDIHKRYAKWNPTVVAIDRVTEGQACTVLMARNYIDNSDDLLIYNADTYCEPNIEALLREIKPRCFDGLISVFKAEGTQWSFAKINAEGFVSQTAEKQRISEWATTGLYHFSNGCDFVRHAEAMISANDRTNNEFYVAPVYNRFIAAGARIIAPEAVKILPLGTPEDLAVYTNQLP